MNKYFVLATAIICSTVDAFPIVYEPVNTVDINEFSKKLRLRAEDSEFGGIASYTPGIKVRVT